MLPTAHKCLLIAELTQNIFKYVSEPDLVSLALTCQFFLNPALDLLWRKQDSLLPLLMCMPSNLWMLRDNQEGGKRRTLVRMRTKSRNRPLHK